MTSILPTVRTPADAGAGGAAASAQHPTKNVATLIDDAWAGLSLLEDLLPDFVDGLDQRTRDRLRFVMHGMVEALDDARGELRK